MWWQHDARLFRVERHEPRITRALEQQRLLLQQPAPALVDADQHRLVAFGVERLEHEARRQQRDLVFGRAPAENYRHPQATRSRVFSHARTVPGAALTPKNPTERAGAVGPAAGLGGPKHSRNKREMSGR
jgi:hypothetical protein